MEQRQHILVVDDQENIRSALSMFLEHMGIVLLPLAQSSPTKTPKQGR